jgi:hypothetical protein
VAVGAAIAAALLVVVLYPTSSPEPVLALSSIAWQHPENDLVPKTQGSEWSQDRLAFVIRVTGFDQQWSQAKIDALYRGLEPAGDIRGRYEIVSPLEVKQTLWESGRSPERLSDMPALLASKLDLTGILILTVRSKGVGLEIEGRLVDAKTGKTVGRTVQDVSRGPDLSQQIRWVAYSILARRGMKH